MPTILRYSTLFGQLSVLKTEDSITLVTHSVGGAGELTVRITPQELKLLLQDNVVSCNFNDKSLDSYYVNKLVLDDENLQIKMYYAEGVNRVKFEYNDWIKLIGDLVAIV